MGGSSSKSSANLVSNTVIVNQTDMNVLNSTTNKFTADVMIENAKSCSAAIIQGQKISAGDVIATKGSKVDISQIQEAKLDFSCLQKDNVQLDIINKIADTLNQTVSNSSNNDILNKMSANVQAKSQDQWGSFPWGGASAESNVNQTVNTYVNNKTNVNIKNVIENSTFANFKNSNISTCLAKIVQDQEIALGNIIASDKSSINLIQKQSAEAIVKCIQEANIAQKVISDLMKFTDLKLEVKNDTNVKNTMEAAAESNSVKQGVFQGFASFFTDIFAGIFGPYVGIGIAVVVLCCIICCVLIISLVFGGSVLSFMGKSKPVTVTATATAPAPVNVSTPVLDTATSSASLPTAP